MNSKRIVLGLGCTLLLALSACSRQQSDWQKTRETNTTDSYELFLKKYPKGEFTAQAQARVKELYEERDWQKARDADTPEAYQAFLKQYPDGRWTEEARIRVENFTLAQAPSGNAAATPGVDTGAAAAGSSPGESATSAPATSPVPATPSASAPKGPSYVSADSAKRASAGAKSQSKGSGRFAVQLGAFKLGATAAHERWADLQKDYPAIVAGLTSRVSPKKDDSGTLYRLQATGLTEKHAREICSALKAKSQGCLVVPPGQG